MGRLRKVVDAAGSIILFASCFAFAGTMAHAQNVCSLTVRALSPRGQRPEVPISVKEQNGRIQEKYQEPGKGDVQFCDLGILPVTVSVGGEGDACNRVTISDVPVSLDRPYLLRVIYDPEACDIWHKMPAPEPQCQLVFRVMNSTGTWLANALIKLSSPRSVELKTDLYGRAEFCPRMKESVQGTVVARGYGDAEFNLVCSDLRQEQLIRLKKR